MQNSSQTFEVVSQTQRLEQFRHSLRQVIRDGEDVLKLGLVSRYASAARSFIEFAKIAELAFDNSPVTVHDMLYFGHRDGEHIGIPVPNAIYREEGDEE